MTVDALLVGTPMPFRDDDHSAIAKRPVDGPVRITWNGLAGDRKSTRLNSSHIPLSRMPSSA